MKKVNKDPFSNGTDFLIFEERNCNRCIKSSQPQKDGISYTNADNKNLPNRCSIQRDIIVRMFSYTPIKQKTIDICRNFILKEEICPYIKLRKK